MGIFAAIRRVFERRYTGKKFYALLALWMAVIIVEANILQNRIGALLFLCEIAAFYLMNVTLYKGSWDRRIFVTVTQYAGAFSISYLTQLLFAFVMSISWEELVNQRALYTGVLFITLIEFSAFLSSFAASIHRLRNAPSRMPG